MSEGSLEYVFYKVEEAAENIGGTGYTDGYNPLHCAFSEHLKKVAIALKAVEWYYSGDWGPEPAEKAIKDVLGPSANTLTFIELQKQGEELIDKIQKFTNAKESTG